MILSYYNYVYPLNLWVGLVEDLPTAVKRFKFYQDTYDLRNDINNVDVSERESIGGVTYLVRHKNKGYIGILILLNETTLIDGDYRGLMDLVCHESGHAVDAVYEYIGENSHTYDEGNEPHSYLLGWFAGCIGDYLTRYFKDNGRKEVRSE